MADALNGARPKLMQIGPYAYDEYYVKFDITWTDGGDTVTYGTQKYYIYNQEETGSGLTADDDLVLPYATLSGFNYLLSTVSEADQQMIDYAIIVSMPPVMLLVPSDALCFSFVALSDPHTSCYV
jgi:hypothetical protein